MSIPIYVQKITVPFSENKSLAVILARNNREISRRGGSIEHGQHLTRDTALGEVQVAIDHDQTLQHWCQHYLQRAICQHCFVVTCVLRVQSLGQGYNLGSYLRPVRDNLFGQKWTTRTAEK